MAPLLTNGETEFQFCSQGTGTQSRSRNSETDSKLLLLGGFFFCLFVVIVGFGAGGGSIFKFLSGGESYHFACTRASGTNFFACF